MKLRLLIFALAIGALAIALSASGNTLAFAQASAQPSPAVPVPQSQTVPADQENARHARALIDQALQALGGQAYLSIHNMEQEGRTYSFYHGRPTSNGVLFWRFVEYPDKERIEVTKERDVAYVYNGDKGYEVTYKGSHAMEKKDLDDYLRRRRFSLETLLRVWINDPKVALFYDGNALAGNLPAEQVTLINSKDEAVHLFFDIETHLPIKKSYTWRDPVDKERNFEEEIYDNFRLVQGVHDTLRIHSLLQWGYAKPALRKFGSHSTNPSMNRCSIPIPITIPSSPRVSTSKFLPGELVSPLTTSVPIPCSATHCGFFTTVRIRGLAVIYS